MKKAKKKEPKPVLTIVVKGAEKTGKTLVSLAIKHFLREHYGFEVQIAPQDSRIATLVDRTTLNDVMKTLAAKGPVRIKEKVKR